MSSPSNRMLSAKSVTMIWLARSAVSMVAFSESTTLIFSFNSVGEMFLRVKIFSNRSRPSGASVREMATSAFILVSVPSGTMRIELLDSTAAKPSSARAR